MSKKYPLTSNVSMMRKSLESARSAKSVGLITPKGKMSPAQIQKRKRTTLSNAANKMFSRNYSK